MMRKRAGGLEKLRTARGEQAVQNMRSFVGDSYSTEFENLANPGREMLATFTDDELAELIATEPKSKQGHIAASILRSREAWPFKVGSRDIMPFSPACASRIP